MLNQWKCLFSELVNNEWSHQIRKFVVPVFPETIKMPRWGFVTDSQKMFATVCKFPKEPY